MNRFQFMSRPELAAAYNNPHLKSFMELKDGKKAGTLAKDVVAKEEGDLARKLGQSAQKYIDQIDKAAERLAKENDLAKRKEIADEIQFYGRVAGNVFNLASLIVSNPDDKKALMNTGKLVGTIANATAELSMNVAKYGAIMATGQFYLAIAVAVLDFINSITGPSQEELVLNAIQGVRQHLIEMENRLRNQLALIDLRIQRMSDQMHSLFRSLEAEIKTVGKNVENVRSHLRIVEQLIRMSDAQFMDVQFEERVHSRNTKLRNCFSKDHSLNSCLGDFQEMVLETTDTASVGQPLRTSDWSLFPDLQPPYFHQISVLQGAAAQAGFPNAYGGVVVKTRSGVATVKAINPLDWSDVANKFALVSIHRIPEIIANPTSYRIAYNQLVTSGEQSGRALLKIGERVGSQDDLNAGQGQSYLEHLLADYKNSVQSLKQAAQEFQKDFEAEHVSRYPLGISSNDVSPRLERAPGRTDNVPPRIGVDSLSFCEDEDSVLKASVPDSARELKEKISAGYLTSQLSRWDLKLPPDFTLLLAPEVRLHQDLQSPLDSYLREKNKTDSGLLTKRSLKLCIESISWSNRFSLASLVAQNPAINEIYETIIDDEDVWSQCSEDEKAIINKAYERISSGKNHFGHNDGDDYLTLSVADVKLIDRAMLIAKSKAGYRPYSVDGRLELESVYEFGYPSVMVRAYYSVLDSPSDKNLTVGRVKFTSKKPVQFATARVDYRHGGTPEAWARWKRLDSYQKPKPPPITSVKSVPEISGEFEGRYFYRAHGNMRMNHFQDVNSPRYDGANQLIVNGNTNMHEPLDKPIFFSELSQSWNGESIGALNSILGKESRSLTEQDLIANGFSVLPLTDDEKNRLAVMKAELRELWAKKRIDLDSRMLAASNVPTSESETNSFGALSKVFQRCKVLVQLIQANFYFSFPKTVLTDKKVASLLYGTESSGQLFGKDRLRGMRANLGKRSVDAEKDLVGDQLSASYKESSLNVALNGDLYKELESQSNDLETVLVALSVGRTENSRVVGQVSGGNSESHLFIDKAMIHLRSMNKFIEASIPKESIQEVEAALGRYLRENFGR